MTLGVLKGSREKGKNVRNSSTFYEIGTQNRRGSSGGGGGRGGGGGGGAHAMHGRCRMAMDYRIPTTPGRSTRGEGVYSICYIMHGRSRMARGGAGGD